MFTYSISEWKGVSLISSNSPVKKEIQVIKAENLIMFHNLDETERVATAC